MLRFWNLLRSNALILLNHSIILLMVFQSDFPQDPVVSQRSDDTAGRTDLKAEYFAQDRKSLFEFLHAARATERNAYTIGGYDASDGKLV